ncbi:MAG: AAA family ATPase [Methylophilus sp.]|uniref:AAA family ATPase n=1 Tax=Methylophilus sp. TaxID=29541 RepID=UPI003FA18BD0
MQFFVHFIKKDKPKPKQYPHAVLTQDNWDDFGYKTTFHVVLHLSDTHVEDLGSIKIIESDRTSGYTNLPNEPFEQLSEKHASIGSSLDYYETLYNLGPQVFRPFLRGLRDIAFSDDAKAAVEDTEAYRVSILRFGGAERRIVDAEKLLKASSMPLKRRSAGFKVKFKTRVASDAKPFTVEFDFRKRNRLPNRINAIIGYNGTGKTRLLSNLAIVASGYGYSNKEAVLSNDAGRFVGNPSPFKTVIVVSYSAFDTFAIPGKTKIEKKKLEEDGELFGYVYCGLRERSEDDSDGEPTYRLRTPAEIQDEFLIALKRVQKSNRMDILLEMLRPLFNDPSFQRIGLNPLYAIKNKTDFAKVFGSLSSGHKVALKIVTELTAHIAGFTPTLVLIDEPETHLHPPLLAAFLRSVRNCLDAFDAYAIIATHSPVVLQETPAKCVRVLRRTGNENFVSTPLNETFAESIGVITKETFNLGEQATDWHETLKPLAKKYSLEEIEEFFERKLGFAARSYIISVQDEMQE